MANMEAVFTFFFVVLHLSSGAVLPRVSPQEEGRKPYAVNSNPTEHDAKPIFGLLGNIINGAAQAVGGVVHGAGHVVEGAAHAVGNVAGEVVHGAGHVVEGAGHAVGNVAGGVVHGAGAVVHGVVHGAGNVVGEAAHAVGNVVDGAAQGFVGGLNHGNGGVYPSYGYDGYSQYGNGDGYSQYTNGYTQYRNGDGYSQYNNGYTQQAIACPMEKGYCVKPNGWDQNSGVDKLNSINGNTRQAQDNCLELCQQRSDATGCEIIWNQGNRGCYVHTQAVARGNGRARHRCWVFSKCYSTPV